jgi:hypothetical protein
MRSRPTRREAADGATCTFAAPTALAQRVKVVSFERTAGCGDAGSSAEADALAAIEKIAASAAVVRPAGLNP